MLPYEFALLVKQLVWLHFLLLVWDFVVGVGGGR